MAEEGGSLLSLKPPWIESVQDQPKLHIETSILKKKKKLQQRNLNLIKDYTAIIKVHTGDIAQWHKQLPGNPEVMSLILRTKKTQKNKKNPIRL